MEQLELFTYEEQKKLLPLLEEIKNSNDEYTIKWDLNSICGINELLGLNAFINGKKTNKTKYFLYKCARIIQYKIIKYNGRNLGYDKYSICYALLSDNKNLIHDWSNLTAPYFKPEKEPSIINSIQNSIKADWEKLDKNIFLLKNKTPKKEKQLTQPFIEVFEGILAKNKKQTEEALGHMLLLHNELNAYHTLYNEFISVDTTGLAKLAWLNGIEVEIDNPLVPKELLPISPLKDEEYEDYDFIKEYLG